LSGASVTYAAGGRGSVNAGNTAGTASTGNGGNAPTAVNGPALNGGSGIVIIKWS
jgi:hypothetical protein